jgi:hypothetical protein
MTPSLHTPFFAQKTRAKEKKKKEKKRAAFKAFLFFCCCFSFTTAATATRQERRDAYPAAAEDAGHNLKNAEAPRHENR